MFALKNKEKYSSIKLCFLILILNIIITSVFSMVLFTEANYGNSIEYNSLKEQVLIFVILGPLVETYVFQKLFLETAVKLTKENMISSIIVAIVFGLAHWYSVPYIFKAFISGLLYNYLYLTIKEKRQDAFLYVLFTHMGFNLFALIINESIAS